VPIVKLAAVAEKAVEFLNPFFINMLELEEKNADNKIININLNNFPLKT